MWVYDPTAKRSTTKSHSEQFADSLDEFFDVERLLDELYDLHSKYITIAAPTFLDMLGISHQQPDEPGDNDVPVHPAQGAGIGEPSLSNMRKTIGSLCSMIEAGALGQGGSSRSRVLG